MLLQFNHFSWRKWFLKIFFLKQKPETLPAPDWTDVENPCVQCQSVFSSAVKVTCIAVALLQHWVDLQCWLFKLCRQWYHWGLAKPGLTMLDSLSLGCTDDTEVHCSSALNVHYLPPAECPRSMTVATIFYILSLQYQATLAAAGLSIQPFSSQTYRGL